jgi:hypothetical protein
MKSCVSPKWFLLIEIWNNMNLPVMCISKANELLSVCEGGKLQYMNTLAYFHTSFLKLLSICLSVCVSVYLSAALYICPFIHLVSLHTVGHT